MNNLDILEDQVLIQYTDHALQFADDTAIISDNVTNA